MNAELREKIAEAIYHVDGGMTDEDYFYATGEKRRLWKTDAPWDTNPDELAEHERDGFRMMAEAAFRAVMGDDPV
jgi:hypothetical protein